MQIRMKVQMSGTRNGEDWPARGELADLPTGEATHLVASGIAEEVTDSDSGPESAIAQKAETPKAAAPAGAKPAPTRIPKVRKE